MRCTIFSISIMLIFVVSSHADTIHVPADQPTIQAGIDAAVDGDTVLVAPDTYVENINFKGKAITVKSSEGAENTLIDGNRTFSVVTIKDGEGPDSVLDGFTVTNGYSVMDGGGLWCISSSPTIRNNIFTENEAPMYGGGIFCFKGAAKISNNKICHNTACKSGYPGSGGGIYCIGGRPVIASNTIHSNHGSEWGGGICCWNSSARVIENIIHDNVGDNGSGIYASGEGNEILFNMIYENHGELFIASGGGICCEGTTLIIGNVIRDNVAGNGYDLGGDGGGIFCSGNTSVINNLIAGNVAFESKVKQNGRGSGIFCKDSTEILNNTIHHNFAGQEGGGIFCQDNVNMVNTILWGNDSLNSTHELHLNNASVYIHHSDVRNGTAWPFVFVDPGSTLNWGPGVIDADPLFVDPVNGDQHLTFLSPCRDSGDNTALALPDFDFEGDPRIYQDTVDIGADEFYTHLYCMGDFTPGGSIEGKLVGLPGTSPVGLFLGTGVLEPPVPTDWGNFHLQAPWLMIPMVPIPGDGVLVLPATIPATPPAPYDLPMQALIGLNPDSLTNLYVLEVR
ncbi:MAG: choice-of-anchor Q domain-containing protein [Planctomycetota bacterium]|jgi:hypothetical protein